MIRKQEITTFEFPENAIIWDVRDAKAYAEGHIKGAVHQPIDSLSSGGGGSVHLHSVWWWQ